jgi:hypothetical protein
MHYCSGEAGVASLKTERVAWFIVDHQHRPMVQHHCPHDRCPKIRIARKNLITLLVIETMN